MGYFSFSHTDDFLALLCRITDIIHTGITHIMFLNLSPMSGIFVWEPYIQKCHLFELRMEHSASGVQSNKDSRVFWRTNFQVSPAKTHCDWL